MKFGDWNKLLNGDTSVLKQEQKINEVTDDKIYRLKWAGGHRTSLVNHNQAIRQVNEQFNRQGWKWIRIINENTKAVQIITEPGPSVNRGVLQLRKLNENMLDVQS